MKQQVQNARKSLKDIEPTIKKKRKQQLEDSTRIGNRRKILHELNQIQIYQQLGQLNLKVRQLENWIYDQHPNNAQDYNKKISDFLQLIRQKKNNKEIHSYFTKNHFKQIFQNVQQEWQSYNPLATNNNTQIKIKKKPKKKQVKQEIKLNYRLPTIIPYQLEDEVLREMIEPQQFQPITTSPSPSSSLRIESNNWKIYSKLTILSSPTLQTLLISQNITYGSELNQIKLSYHNGTELFNHLNSTTKQIMYGMVVLDYENKERNAKLLFKISEKLLQKNYIIAQKFDDNNATLILLNRKQLQQLLDQRQSSQTELQRSAMVISEWVDDGYLDWWKSNQNFMEHSLYFMVYYKQDHKQKQIYPVLTLENPKEYQKLIQTVQEHKQEETHNKDDDIKNFFSQNPNLLSQLEL